MLKKSLTIVGAIVAAVSISSCATMSGVGQDVQTLGQGVQKAAR